MATRIQKVHDKLVTLLKVLNALPSPNDDITVDQETCGGIVREAGDLVAEVDFELFEESYMVAPDIELPELGVGGPLSNPQEARAYVAKCIKSLSIHETAPGPNYESRKPRILNHLKEHLSPSHRMAYDQYQEAARTFGGYMTDQAAYDWLQRRYRDTPEFETWVRYLRHGRRFYNNKKNNPRHGRSFGPSVVRASDIEDRWQDDDE
jgi:hypothetical protein